MSSLFHRKGTYDCELVKLPKFCTPSQEGENLRAKREARLRWMHERGIRYLGNPMRTPDRRAPGTPVARSRAALSRAALARAAIERPGDAIVRDLVSNGH